MLTGRTYGTTAMALGLAAFLWCGASAAQAQTTILSYDFNSLSTGTLTGQGGWGLTPGTGNQSPTVAAGPAGSVDTSQVIGSAATNNGEAHASVFSASSLTSSSVVTLKFDLYAGSTSANELFGIGSSTVTAASFGIYSDVFAIRGQGYSTLVNAVDGSGATVKAITGHWYTVESVWDLASNTGTLAILDLTAGATAFTTLYFDQAQTDATAALGLTNLGTTNSPSLWTDAYLRTAFSGSTGYLDNLSVTVAAVPEPRTWAMLLLGMAFLGACTCGKRRSSALSR